MTFLVTFNMAEGTHKVFPASPNIWEARSLSEVHPLPGEGRSEGLAMYSNVMGPPPSPGGRGQGSDRRASAGAMALQGAQHDVQSHTQTDRESPLVHLEFWGVVRAWRTTRRNTHTEVAAWPLFQEQAHVVTGHDDVAVLDCLTD